MHKPILARFERLGVHPVRRRARRIVAVERDRPVHAAEYGLLDRAHVLHAAELAQFLQPQVFEIALRELDRFGFHRIVRAAKQHALPRRQILQLQRREPAFEIPLQTEPLDRPDHLRIHAVLQRIADAAIDDRIGVAVLNQAEDDQQRNEAGFRRGAPALEPVFRMPFLQKVLQHAAERLLDIQRVEINVHPRPAS